VLFICACVIGSEVYALWIDNVLYSGHIVSLTSDSRARVVFDDEERLNVPLEHIIVCDLLPLGMSVRAPRSDDVPWSEEATVIGHCEHGIEKGHTVKFISDQYQRK